MKALLLAITLTLSAPALANECNSHFLDGEIAQTTASNKFVAGGNDFRAAWDLDEEDPANHPQICVHLKSAIENFAVAADYYQEAMLHFAAAIEYCEPEREAEAAERAAHNSQQRNQAREFSEGLSNNIPDYCS